MRQRRRGTTPARSEHNSRKPRKSCCIWLQRKMVRLVDDITGQTSIKKQAKKTRKRLAKQQRKAKEEADASFVVNGLRYMRPFIRGQDSTLGPCVQIDRPIAAGPIPILYHSDRLIAVAKPAPIPSEKNTDYTRSHMRSVLKHQLDIHGRLSALHRLDICTTGVMLWSTTKAGTRCFSNKISNREVQKIYLALVRGEFPAKPTVCEVDVDHKQSLTTFYRLHVNDSDSVAERGGLTTLVLCVPKTGRTHQIRKHLKHLGYPIANDPRYGGAGGQQTANRAEGLEQYQHPDVVAMFESALERFGKIDKLKGLDVLREHVECCNGRVPEGGSPWNTTWLNGIYLHAWMYYGQGGLKDEEDMQPWCFAAPRPSWASGLREEDLPPEIREKLQHPTTN